jgi:hypothetical protein
MGDGGTANEDGVSEQGVDDGALAAAPRGNREWRLTGENNRNQRPARRALRVRGRSRASRTTSSSRSIGRVQVDPRVLGAHSTLTATLGTANARCEVIVAQNEGDGPRLQIKIVDEAQGRFRAYVERESEVTTIKIFGAHSAIKRYLGPGPEFPQQESLQARLVIAEIIAGEAARLVMEKKYRAPGDLDGPAFYAEHLLYMDKYLQRCHRMMLADNEQP